ncbi:MAG: EamA family transporter [Cyanobacteria bacterium P01_D01_bin.56]
MKLLSAFSSRILTGPPHFWFVISAIFHYLGPSFAVLLFERIDVLGVAWFRITSAAVIFAFWTKPWRTFRAANQETVMLLWLLGACLAFMNSAFYLAIERLPLSLVATMEFVGTIAVALFQLKTVRNYVALALAVAGVMTLIDVRWSDDLLGLGWAAINALLFMTYVILGHRISQQGAGKGIDRLGAAMAAAFVFVIPIGSRNAISAFTSPLLILAGIGVGISSSVIPYVCDQLAMSQLSRNTYALLLTLLPATATAIGAVALGQIPTPRDIYGILLVMTGVVLHKPAEVI